MSVALPKLRVGDPVHHESLTVFPLFSDADSHVDYRLSEAALADESLLIEEVSESGSVPDLLVENKGDLPWEQAEAVGEGEEYRAESARGDHASALAFEDTVVHESLMAAI